MPLLLRVLCVLLVLVSAAHAACVGDCAADGEVSVSDLVSAVGIALGSTPLTQCPAADANGNGSVAVDELVAAVNAALSGCGDGSTPTLPAATATATPSPSPTVTETPAVGPRIGFFGVSSADDVLQTPDGVDGNGTPIYQRNFGFGFRLVVEAASGTNNISVGRDAFNDGVRPALQVQVTRALGNGSPTVCDAEAPNFGGVPAIDPPLFDDSAAVVDALNDLGCRFIDGVGQPQARGCMTSCIRDSNGDYACHELDTDAQFCALVDAPLEFPLGDTLVSVRVRDVAGNLGAPKRLILRVQP